MKTAKSLIPWWITVFITSLLFSFNVPADCACGEWKDVELKLDMTDEILAAIGKTEGDHPARSKSERTYVKCFKRSDANGVQYFIEGSVGAQILKNLRPIFGEPAVLHEKTEAVNWIYSKRQIKVVISAHEIKQGYPCIDGWYTHVIILK